MSPRSSCVSCRPRGRAARWHLGRHRLHRGAGRVGHRSASQLGELVLDRFAGDGIMLMVAVGADGNARDRDRARAGASRDRRRRTSGTGRLILGDARGCRGTCTGRWISCSPSPRTWRAQTIRRTRSPAMRPMTVTTPCTYGELGSIFAQAATLLRPGGRIVVNIANVVAHGRHGDAAGERSGERHRPARAVARHHDPAMGRAARRPGGLLLALVGAPGVYFFFFFFFFFKR